MPSTTWPRRRNTRPRAVCVVFGNEAFLRRQSLLKLREAVLGGDEADFSLTVFDGRNGRAAATCSKNWPPWPCSAASGWS